MGGSLLAGDARGRAKAGDAGGRLDRVEGPGGVGVGGASSDVRSRGLQQGGQRGFFLCPLAASCSHALAARVSQTE